MDCTFPPLVEIRENSEFHDLMRMDKAHWPRCLLWHGWVPMLSGVNGAAPWAVDASEIDVHLVEVAPGLTVLMMSLLLLGYLVIRKSGLMESCSG